MGQKKRLFLRPPIFQFQNELNDTGRSWTILGYKGTVVSVSSQACQNRFCATLQHVIV